MIFSSDFWLIDVMAQHLESLTLRIEACADFYTWRNHREARWGRVLRRWERKRPEHCQLCKKVISPEALPQTPRIVFYDARREAGQREYAHAECVKRSTAGWKEGL